MFSTYNVELDRPTLEEARRMVASEIRQARQRGVRVLKIIHGYGSSGKGGTLCFGLRKSFALRKKEGVLKAFIPGEDFSIFDPTTLELLEKVSAIRGDPDLGAANPGADSVIVRGITGRVLAVPSEARDRSQGRVLSANCGGWPGQQRESLRKGAFDSRALVWCHLSAGQGGGGRGDPCPGRAGCVS